MSRNILYTLAKNTKAIYVLATFFLLSICTTIQAEYGVGWGGINQPNVEFSVGFGATPLAACVQYDAVLDANGTGTPAVSYKILSSGATANAGFPPYVMSRPGCEMLYSSGFTDVAELYTIDDEPDPFKNGGGGGSCRVTAGNPINIATGNKFHSEIDFDRQSPSQVFFERFYNSISTSRGSMGGNWSTTYDRSIKIGTSSIIVFRPDGKSFKFTLNGSNWVSDADITDILKMNGGLWTYTTKDDSVETYNANGVLISIDYVNGQKLSLSYDSNNRLLNVVDLLNKQQLTFQYDGRDRISSVTDNADRRWIYNYDNNGNLTLVTYPDATKKQYHYANTVYRNALTGITDERNIRFSTYDYDIHGRAILSTHANNAGRISVVYNTDGTRTVTNGNVNDSSYGITSNLGTALVSSITGPACTSCANGDTNIFYDSSNNIISKNEFGTTIQYGDYDNLGNPGYKIEAAGTSEERRIDYTYDPTFHSRVATIIEPSVVDDQNKVTTYTYDDFGNRTAITVSGFAPDGGAGFVPVSRTTTFKYDGPLNQLSEIDGPRRNNEVIDLTYLSYYPNDVTEDFNRARLKQLIGPEGIVLRDNIQYTATGKVLSEQRPNGVSIAYIYYPGNDRLDTLTEADGTNIRVTKWTYLATGEVETITQAFGTTLATTITLGYDDARRLTSITDNLGNKIVYTLDTEGNKIQDDIKDVGGVLFRTVQQTFDAYNRLDTRTLIDEVMDFNIAPDGTLDNQTDANNISTDYNYDSLKRLTSVTGDLGGADPNTQDTLTQYVYDVADRLTNVITPNDATTEYVYDDLGNLLKETSPDRGTRTYTYDEAGNVKTITDARGITATYSYDGLNRVIGIDYPGTEEDIVMTYDNCANGVGQLCQISDQSGTTDYVYSAFGNIIDHIKIEAGVSYTTHYEYDILNRVLQTTTPTGRVIDYGYDSLNRITHIDANINGAAYIIAHNAAYRADGPLTGFEFGNGFVDNRMYNLKGQLTAVSMPSEQSVMQPSQAVNDSATIDNDNGQPITVLSNDTYAVFNDVNISITTPASFGTAVVNSDKTITYIPNAGFIGIDTFAYQLNEGSDNSIATVDVTVIDGDFDNDGLTNSVDLDDDNDGIPDAWELSYGLDPLNAADAMLDLDGDGVSNFDEFTQGTDPSTKPIARITQNLQALYAFNEGAGSIINDVSGVGAALPLSITGDVVWTTTGIQLNNGVLVSSGVADKLITSLQASNEITIEAWLTPANISQSGPARIVTLSADPYQRNFTLGQAADAYDTRLRTTSTNNNGIPSIRSAAGTATTAQTHVAYTRDAAGKATLYVNGVEQLTSTIGGDLSNWNTGYRLAIGNELTNDRPWQGEVNLVAIYNRALSAGEMSQNHTAGPDGNSNAVNQSPIANAGANQTVNEGGTVNLDGSASTDSDGLISSYSWVQSAGPSVSSLTDANTSSPSFIAPQVTAATTLSFTLTVTDNQGASASSVVTLLVNDVPVVNQPPTVNGGTNQAVNEGSTITLDGSASVDPEGNPLTFLWQQIGGSDALPSDATTAITTIVAPQVSSQTQYTYQLTVTDDQGLSANATVIITVNDLDQPPSARITQNLQALYTFNEGTGGVINDVSGVGAALPLSITGDVVWTTTGLQLNNGALASSGVADKLITSIQASNEITIEAWLTPANISQSGPARIVTLSADPYQRNFTLGQAADAYDTRLRTTSTNSNGIPSIRSAAGTATIAQTHVAYTRDAAGKATLYVNGVEQLTSTIGGDLSNWNTGYRLAIGNELTNDRPWQGEVNLVAIYNRALSAGEMSQNHIAGPNGNSTTNQVPVDSADAMNNQRQLVVVSNDKMSHSQLRSKAKQATFITLRKGPETNHQWIQTAEDPNAYDRPDTVYYVTADNISVWQRAKSDEASNVASYQRMPFDAKALIAKLDRNEPSVDGFIKVNHGTPSNPISIDAETWTYAYDANGNVESILSSTGDHIYTYDALNRVIEDTRPSQSRETINYDRNGNRTGKTIDAITDTYNYIANSNKLDSDPVGQVTHDAAGNRISDQGGNRTFEYNNAGRLLKVYEGSTLNAEYVYNAQGQRTRKITPSGITVYHYDLAGNVISETTETGSPIRDYVYMGSIPVAQIDTDGTTDTLSYLHTDHLGTPRRATNEAGEVVWSWDSDAFGQTAANNDPDGDGNSTIINLRFAGQYFDSETKLHYNYFRYYDPQSGRYITSDPIGLIAGTNTYGYVLGNPLKYNDPLGLRTNCTQCILDCDTIFGWDMDDSSIYFVFGKDQCRGMMIGGTTCLYNFKFQYELEIRDNEFNQKQCILNCSSTCTEEGSNGCS